VATILLVGLPTGREAAIAFLREMFENRKQILIFLHLVLYVLFCLFGAHYCFPFTR
jgi:hypothetical protein